MLEVGDDVVEVLSTNGDTHLGGDDFDEELINFIADEFKNENGIDLRKDAMALQRLREAAEKAKKELSSSQTTDINLPFITADASGAKHLQMTITRAEFERLVDHLIERCREPVTKALNDAKLKPNADRRSRAGRRFDARSEGAGTRPQDVRQGAAQGGQSRTKSSRSAPRFREAIIAGDVKDVRAARRDAAVARNRNRRGRDDRARRTQHDDSRPRRRRRSARRPTIRRRSPCSVFQGERKMAADNRLLGQFNLDGIPPAPRGVPQIEVTFNIDVNGILNVSAKDLGTGKEQTVKIEQSSGLSEAEIEQDAEGRRRACRRRPAETEAGRGPQQGAQPRSTRPRSCSRNTPTSSTPARSRRSKRPWQRSNRRPTATTPRRSSRRSRNSKQAAHAMSKHMYERAGQAAPRRRRGGGRAGAAAASRAGDGEDVIDAEFEKKE